MAEPLKNLFNPGVILEMSAQLARIPGFDTAGFETAALNGLESLEMMQRSAQIAAALRTSLPQAPFSQTLAALSGILHPETEAELDSLPLDGRGLRGWALVPVGTLVAEDGLGHPQESLRFLREMTMRFSAEFAVRPFFRDHTALTLAHAQAWARDANFHVRRLASEGSRPRLPWGLRLAAFVETPAPLIPILTALRDDPAEYVRRSVANSLNDIAKDHPDLVARLAADWLQGAPPPRRKLVKHALRSLIKAGHPGALAALGYRPPDGVTAALGVAPDTIRLGDSVTLSLSLQSPSSLPVLIDYAVFFRKADGRLSPKVFKWTETRLDPNVPLTLSKRVPLRDVTTRRHYPGEQAVAVQVNGVTLAKAGFNLELAAG
ncbi:MAG: DNA alkylation repair protein [Rhodobacter sp.]|nr:DNA alkylation repair protein [Rhodobacter sp.]